MRIVTGRGAIARIARAVDIGLRALALRPGETGQALAVEQQLRAEQADAVGVLTPGDGDVFDAVDVGLEADP